MPKKDSCINGLEKRVACRSDKRSISLNEFSANVCYHRIPSTHTEIIARYFEPILRQFACKWSWKFIFSFSNFTKAAISVENCVQTASSPFILCRYILLNKTRRRRRQNVKHRRVYNLSSGRKVTFGTLVSFQYNNANSHTGELFLITHSTAQYYPPERRSSFWFF